MSDKLLNDLAQHLASRALRETAEEQENRYKRLLLDDLLVEGEEDSKGHRTVEFEGGLPFGRDKDGGVRIVSSIRREKRAPLSLDPDKVEKLVPDEQRPAVFKTTITVEGLTDTMAEAVSKALLDLGLVGEEQTFIDEDALLSLNYEEQISDDDLKAMYVEGKVVYALKVNYAK